MKGAPQKAVTVILALTYCKKYFQAIGGAVFPKLVFPPPPPFISSLIAVVLLS